MDVRGHPKADTHNGLLVPANDGILFLDRVELLVDDVFRRRVYADQPETES